MEEARWSWSWTKSDRGTYRHLPNQFHSGSRTRTRGWTREGDTRVCVGTLGGWLHTPPTLRGVPVLSRPTAETGPVRLKSKGPFPTPGPSGPIPRDLRPPGPDQVRVSRTSKASTSPRSVPGRPFCRASRLGDSLLVGRTRATSESGRNIPSAGSASFRARSSRSRSPPCLRTVSPRPPLS